MCTKKTYVESCYVEIELELELEMAPYNPPANTNYTEVQVPRHVNMYKLMGRNGVHFKRITEDSKCSYIWLDVRRRIVEIWGREKYIPSGVSKVRRRIGELATSAVTIPPEYMNAPNEDTRYINVYSWDTGCQISYEIIGPEIECQEFYKKYILSEYPYNPYMTRIEEKTPMRMVVSRFRSCD
jgi:hypothetical protein